MASSSSYPEHLLFKLYDGNLKSTTQQRIAITIATSKSNGRRPPDRRKWRTHVPNKPNDDFDQIIGCIQKTLSPKFTVQQNVDAFRRVMQAQFDRKERERSGSAAEPLMRGDLFDTSESVDPVVQIVLQNQYEDFGFPIYRVNYDDEGKWARWYEKFGELLETSLEGVSGGERIKERLILYKVEDSELDHMPFQAVQDYHSLMLEDQAFPLGVATGAAIAVDVSVMDALLTPVDGVPPWVYVLDESYDFANSESDLAADEFPGYMPVAIDSLLPDLWPGLQSGLSLMELWATWTYDEEHPVWTDALGF